MQMLSYIYNSICQHVPYLYCHFCFSTSKLVPKDMTMFLQCLSVQAGKLCREEKVPGALCFSATPTGNCDQPCIAVGTSTCLAVYSTADWSMVLSHKTVAAVMCLLRAESTLYAGLANGAILVINLKVIVYHW